MKLIGPYAGFQQHVIGGDLVVLQGRPNDRYPGNNRGGVHAGGSCQQVDFAGGDSGG